MIANDDSTKTVALTKTISRKRTLLKEKQAADFLEVKPVTLRSWRWRGLGPRYLRLGRAIRYDLKDLEEFLERSTVLPPNA